MSQHTIDLILRIQAIAQTGITYSKDAFDIERFEELQVISSKLLSEISDIPQAALLETFVQEKGYPTPKLGTRAAVFKDDKILLVQEKLDGLWNLPGGWVDADQTIRSNVIKEVYEESGLEVQPIKIISVVDKRKDNPKILFGLCSVIVLCEFLGGTFTENIEINQSGFFALDELPPLSSKRSTLEQVETCFAAYKAEKWEPVFD